MKLAPFEARIPEGRETADGYVCLKHNTQYTVVLINHGDSRCDAEVKIDGRKVGTWRIRAGASILLERPIHDTGKFTFYVQGTKESASAGLITSDDLGRVAVKFMPERQSPLFMAAPGVQMMAKPAFIGDELSMPTAPNSPKKIAGGTGLSGRSEQGFSDAEDILRDPDGERTINLRLVAEDQGPRPLFNRETSVPPAVAARTTSSNSALLEAATPQAEKKSFSFMEVVALGVVALFAVFMVILFNDVGFSGGKQRRSMPSTPQSFTPPAAVIPTYTPPAPLIPPVTVVVPPTVIKPIVETPRYSPLPPSPLTASISSPSYGAGYAAPPANTQPAPVSPPKDQFLRHLASDERLRSGTILNDLLKPMAGKGTLTMINGLVEDVFVKLVQGNLCVASFYVRGGQNFTFPHIPDGNYLVTYCTGYGWGGTQGDFRRGRHAAKYDELLTYATRVSGRTIYTDVMSLTLHKVSNGNAPTTDIPVEEFDRY